MSGICGGIVFVSRADMESASSVCQSLRAAGQRLPEELSAPNDVGWSRLAIEWSINLVASFDG